MKEPRVSGALWERIEVVFHAARARPASEREGFLADACAGDEELYREVASLLAALDDEAAFPTEAGARLAEEMGRSPEISQAETVADPSEESGSLPRQIGPYTLQRRLGEGGMGTVYLAQQSDPLPRLVALKLIREGWMSKEALRRFERERRAMASLNHPAIAQVYDAGSDRGRPYVVLEYIPGLPITEHCDQRRLGIRPRVELMLEVCEGVRYAHENGLIHRDLKPSNLLVREVGERSIPKIIDFGIAKALEPSGQTSETATRLRLGSPGYMSPEAVLEGATTTDQQTDVYSLGVVLYQLLVGARPYDRAPWLLGVPFAEVGRPPMPSERWKGLAPERRREVAAGRGTHGRGLTRRLQGDLDRIVHRAVATASADRHGSVAELIHDLERWLEGRPVETWPVRWARRGRRLAVYAAAFLAALLAALVLPDFFPREKGRSPEGLEPETVEAGGVPRSRQVTGNAVGTLPVGVGEHWVEAEVRYFYGDLVSYDTPRGGGKGWVAAIIFTQDPEPEYGIIYHDENGDTQGRPAYADEIETIERPDIDPTQIWPDDVPHEITRVGKDRLHLRVRTDYALGEVMPFENEEGEGRGVVVGFEVDELGIIYYQLLPEGAESILSVVQSEAGPSQIEAGS